MRSMALVVLALAGLAWTKTREPVDPGTANGARLRDGAPIQLGKGEAAPTWCGTRRAATRSRSGSR